MKKWGYKKLLQIDNAIIKVLNRERHLLSPTHTRSLHVKNV